MSSGSRRRILAAPENSGWSRSSFWPHGGHVFCFHLAAALGLDGVEVNPLSFQPFGGLSDGAQVEGGEVRPPQAPGVGFETRNALFRYVRELVGD